MHISFADTKLYKVVVENNPCIKDAYASYISTNRMSGNKNRISEWIFLFRICILFFCCHKKPTVYVKTSESEIEKRTAPQHFIKQLLPYDVISFDVFDTLIFRPFSNPKVVFNILESENQIEHFASFRVSAEEQVRCLKYNKDETREVTLEEIYDYIEKYTGLNKEEGMQNEIAKEMDICFTNPYMLNVFNMLKAYGKKIVIISDMYLDETVIKKILSKNGYSGYENIYVSCHYQKSKSTGELYEVVKEQMGENLSYVHIGDNHHSDFEMARQAGWRAVYYRNINEIGEKYRADGMSELIKAASEGIINTRLYNGMNIYSPAYEFGYTNGGLYCLGYVKWIHDFALKNNIQKVIFLARDGDIYQKIYDKLYTDIESKYAYWSRIVTIKCNIEKDRYDFIRRIALYPILNDTDISIKEVLESVDLMELINDLQEWDLDQNEKLSEDNRDIFEQFIIDHMEKIKEIYAKEELCAQQYLKSVIGNKTKVAIVDVGWAGSGPLGIKFLIEKKWKWNCKIECLVAASSDSGTYKLLEDKLHVYMFAKNYNRIHYDFHYASNKGKINSDCFELLTQATHPSFRGFERERAEYGMSFSTPYVEGYKYIKEFHEGILDFAKDYTRVFQRYEMFMNISGYDAYCAFRSVLENLNFLKHNFGDFPCECNTGKSTRAVTLREYFENKGIE